MVKMGNLRNGLLNFYRYFFTLGFENLIYFFATNLIIHYYLSNGCNTHKNNGLKNLERVRHQTLTYLDVFLRSQP